MIKLFFIIFAMTLGMMTTACKGNYEQEGQIKQAIKEYRLAADRGGKRALTLLQRLCAADGGKYCGERGCPKPDAREAYEIWMLEDFEGRKEPTFFQLSLNNTKHVALPHGLEPKAVYRGKQAERLAMEYAGYEEDKTTEYWMLNVNVPLTRATHLSCMTRGSLEGGMVMLTQFAGKHYEVLWDRGLDLDRKYQLDEWRAGDLDWQMNVSEDVYAWVKKTAVEKKLSIDGARIVLLGLPAMSLNQNYIEIDNIQAWFKIDLVAKKSAVEKVLASDSASAEEKARARRELDKLGSTIEAEGQLKVQKAYFGNLMRDGTIKTIEPGSANWAGWNVARVNDGVTAWGIDNTYGYTTSDPEVLNNDRGLTLTFNRSVALTTLIHWSYSDLTFNYVIEYFTGGAWAPVATVTCPKGTPTIISFNADQSKSSTQWRWYISDWKNPGRNFYAFELEVYESILVYLKNNNYWKLIESNY